MHIRLKIKAFRILYITRIRLKIAINEIGGRRWRRSRLKIKPVRTSKNKGQLD
jgi:hypothetical protein